MMQDHPFFNPQLLDYYFVGHWFEFFFLLYFLIVNGFYAFLYFASLPQFYQRFKEAKSEQFTKLLSSDSLPPIAILIPGYNENYTLVQSIQSAFNVNYPHIEIVAIDDGSTDNTMEILKKEFQLSETPAASRPLLETGPIRAYYRSELYPNLLVIEKREEAKALL